MANQKIFFSYSRVDGSAFASRLADDLQKKGFDVWMDRQDIRAGQKWDAEIEKALQECDCLLFFETEKSVASSNVLDEVYYALEHNKKVIPLIYVDSITPFRLHRLQHVDFTQNYRTGLAMLVQELEGGTPAVTYPPKENDSRIVSNKPFYKRKYTTLIIFACLAVLIAVIAVFTGKNKTEVPAKTEATTNLKDTSSNKTGELANGSIASVVTSSEENNKAKDKLVPNEKKRQSQSKKAAGSSPSSSSKPAQNKETKTTVSLSDLNENLSGDWRLTDMEPKAQSQRGYLKIEALSDNKAAIKSYIQFYYPESKASSYLTIFNAFVGCSSCVLNNEMKLKVEDIAVGSRTIERLQEDQADGRKAGDIILDAHRNKSVGGTATLRFTDDNNAVIIVRRTTAIMLADELLLEPFVYTFHFKKND